jgi:hypothetical protein
MDQTGRDRGPVALSLSLMHARQDLSNRKRHGMRVSSIKIALVAKKVSVARALQLPTSVQGKFISQLNVGEPPHAAPHNGIAWRRIAGSGEIAPKPGDLDQVAQERWQLCCKR